MESQAGHLEPTGAKGKGSHWYRLEVLWSCLARCFFLIQGACFVIFWCGVPCFGADWSVGEWVEKTNRLPACPSTLLSGEAFLACIPSRATDELANFFFYQY